METQTTTELQPLETILCHRPGCNYDFTAAFNIQRFATFKVIQLHYTEMRNTTKGLAAYMVPSKTRTALKKHASGKITSKFHIMCPECRKKVFFMINTLNGDVTQEYDQPIKTIPEIATEVAPLIKEGPRHTFDKESMLHIDRYPTGHYHHPVLPEKISDWLPEEESVEEQPPSET